LNDYKGNLLQSISYRSCAALQSSFSFSYRGLIAFAFGKYFFIEILYLFSFIISLCFYPLILLNIANISILLLV